MMIPIGKITRFSIFLFLCSCSPTSLEDLRYEGEVQTKKLALELRAIETREELQRSIPKLKKRFNKIADLLVQCREFQKIESEPSAASEQLFAELARLYEMPGGRELIESAQVEAIHRLNRY